MPLFFAGQRVRASQLNIISPLIAKKPADTPRASVTALADDPDLTVAVEPNAVYSFEMFLGTLAVPAADVAVAFTKPAGSVLSWGTFGAHWTDAASPPTLLENSYSSNDTATTSSTKFYAGNGANCSAIAKGTLTTGTAGGAFTLQWAQVASNASASWVLQGSYIQLVRQPS